MGLPMWRDETVVVERKSAIKADPTASTRSPIRRQPPVRTWSNRYIPGNQSPRIGSGVDRRALLGIIRRDREYAHSASAEENTWGQSLADIARLEASNRRRLENGRALLRDALSYEQPGHRMRIRVSALRHEMPPPVPAAPGVEDQSRDDPITWGHVNMDDAEERRSPRPRHTPTPPYGSTEAGEHSPLRPFPAPARLLSSSVTPAQIPSLTPRFAPAYGYEDTDERYYLEETRPLPRIRYEDAREHGRARSSRTRHGPSDLDIYGRPPLRRTHRRWRHEPRPYGSLMAANQNDGLGDRRRSLSPEEDTWETLLTTIAPDERLPTPSSSFTSATASASSLSSNSASSSGTLLTAPSSAADDLRVLANICDDPTDSELTDTDYEPPFDDPSYRSRIEREGYLDDPPAPDPTRYSANLLARARWASREINDHFVRSRRRAEQDIEYQQMQAMMARMDRHEEVPDEFWATAGLSRSVSGRVERIERERL